MDLLTLLEKAETDGVRIRADGDDLCITGDPRKHGAIMNQLRRRKPEVLEALRSEPSSNGCFWHCEPEPLPDPLPAVKPYTSELLPAAIGDAVDDISERMQCPPDFPAASMLVAISSVVGCQLGIRPRRQDNWLCVPNLWGCVIGRPALKKSPATRNAESRLRALETKFRVDLETDVHEAEIDSTLLPEKISVIKQQIKTALKDGNDGDARRLADSLRRLESQEAPSPRRIITNDPTLPKIGEMLNKHSAGMLLWVDELVGWMRRLDRQDQAGDREAYLTLWNGDGRWNIDRIGRGEIEVNACLSIFGCCTPGPLTDLIANAVRGGRGDDGLIQRFQIAVWPDSPTDYQLIDRQPNSAAREKLAEVFERLGSIEPDGIGVVDQFSDSGIPCMRFSPEAQEIFNDWDLTHQKRLRGEDLPAAFESHLAKYASMVPSIAMLLHLVESDDHYVGLEPTLRALKWADYLESHAKRLYAVAVAPERVHAKKLLTKLIKWPTEKPIRIRDIERQGWSGLTERKTIAATLELLADSGWVRILDSNVGSGRPTTTYEVHPQAAEKLKAMERD